MPNFLSKRCCVNRKIVCNTAPQHPSVIKCCCYCFKAGGWRHTHESVTEMGVFMRGGRLSGPLFEELQGITEGSRMSAVCACVPAHNAKAKWRLQLQIKRPPVT